MGPWVSSIADNLPVATRLELYSNRDSDDKKKEKDVQFEHGYRLGFTDVNKVECLWCVQRAGEPQALGATEKRETFLSRLVTERWGRPKACFSQCPLDMVCRKAAALDKALVMLQRAEGPVTKIVDSVFIDFNQTKSGSSSVCRRGPCSKQEQVGALDLNHCFLVV